MIQIYTGREHTGLLVETADELRAEITRATFAIYTAVLDVYYLATARVWVKWWDMALCDYVVLLVYDEPLTPLS